MIEKITNEDLKQKIREDANGLLTTEKMLGAILFLSDELEKQLTHLTTDSGWIKRLVFDMFCDKNNIAEAYSTLLTQRLQNKRSELWEEARNGKTKGDTEARGKG